MLAQLRRGGPHLRPLCRFPRLGSQRPTGTHLVRGPTGCDCFMNWSITPPGTVAPRWARRRAGLNPRSGGTKPECHFPRLAGRSGRRPPMYTWGSGPHDARARSTASQTTTSRPARTNGICQASLPCGVVSQLTHHPRRATSTTGKRPRGSAAAGTARTSDRRPAGHRNRSCAWASRGCLTVGAPACRSAAAVRQPRESFPEPAPKCSAVRVAARDSTASAIRTGRATGRR